MLNKSFYLVLFITALFLFACPDREDPIDSEITIYNNSAWDVVWFLDFNLSQDTSINALPYPLSSNNIGNFIIYSNNSLTFPGAWKYYFEERSPQILMLYIFNKDTIEQVSWERIEQENLVEKRYDLTLEILDSLNWTITYP